MRWSLCTLLALGGCSTIFGFQDPRPYDGDGGPDADTTHPLSIVSTTPLNGATGEQRNTVPTVTFNTALDPTTILGITMTIDGVPVIVTINLDTPTTISVHLAGTFPLLANCVVTVPTSVHNTFGDALVGGPATLSFQIRDGTWTTGHLLDASESTGTMDARNPLVGMDAAGEAVAIWEQDFTGFTAMMHNEYRSGWGTASTIDSSGVTEVLAGLYVTSAGASYAAFNQGTGVHSAIALSVGGTWNVNALDASSVADTPAVPTPTYAYWTQGGSYHFLSIAGGAPNPPQASGINTPLSVFGSTLLFGTAAPFEDLCDVGNLPTPMDNQPHTSLALTGENNILIGAWTTGPKVRGLVRSTGTNVFDIDTNATTSDVSVVADTSGRATAIWRRHDTTLPASDTVWASSAMLPAVPTWTPTRIDHTDGGVATEPNAVIGPTGEIFVVWVNASAGVSVIRYVNGQWETNKTIVYSGGSSVTHPRIATDSLGDAIVVWQATSGGHLVAMGSELF
jgi:hypothetical protein